MPYLMGIDIGTSGTKTILIDETGHVHARAAAEYPLYSPQPQWSEQEPEDWWKAVCATVREVLQSSGLGSKTDGSRTLEGHQRLAGMRLWRREVNCFFSLRLSILLQYETGV